MGCSSSNCKVFSVESGDVKDVFRPQTEESSDLSALRQSIVELFILEVLSQSKKSHVFTSIFSDPELKNCFVGFLRKEFMSHGRELSEFLKVC